MACFFQDRLKTACTKLRSWIGVDDHHTVGFASNFPYSFGTATPSTTDSGFLWYDSHSTPAAPKFWDGAAFQALISGKILQGVRAMDETPEDPSLFQTII